MDSMTLVVCITMLALYSYFMDKSHQKVEKAHEEYIKELEKRVKIYEEYVDRVEGSNNG